MTRLTSGEQQQRPKIGLHELSLSNSGDELVFETEIQAFDEDPFDDLLDVDGSVADYLPYARLTCLPCKNSNLTCDEVVPRCGSCKDLNLKCCRLGNTQARKRKGGPQSNIRPSHIETVDITETPSPNLTGRNPELRVYSLGPETPEEPWEQELAAPSIFPRDSDPPEGIDHSQEFQHNTTRQSGRSLHSLLRDNQGYTPSRIGHGAPSAKETGSNTRDQRHNDFESLGKDDPRRRQSGFESRPIKASSSISDNETDVAEFVAQTQGPPGLWTASHSPAPTFGYPETDLPHATHLEKARSSSASDKESLSRNTRLFRTRDPGYNKDPGKIHQTAIPRFYGRKSFIQVTTQQAVSLEISSNHDGHNGLRATPTVRKTPVPAIQRSLSRDRSRSDSSEDSATPISHWQKRRPGTRSPGAKSKRQLDSSEDSDPPMTFPRRRRLNTYRRTRLKHADTPDPSLKRSHPKESHTFEGFEVGSSDSDAPLVPSWIRPPRIFTPSSVDHYLHDDNPSSLLQTEGTQESQNPQLSPQPGDSLLDHLSTSTCGISIPGSRSPTGLTVDDERHRITPITPQSGKPIDLVSKPSSAELVIGNSAGGEVSARSVRQNLQSLKPRKSKQGKAQQNVTLDNRATHLADERPAFGFEDIVPKADSSKSCSFTIADIIPSKTLREPKLPRHELDLNEFHDALRMSFAPVVVGPDWILNAPMKKRKFTLADVTGTGPHEPLFSIEYALEQFRARQGNQEQRSPEESTDQAQGSEEAITEEQEVASYGREIMRLGGSGPSEGRPIYDGHDIIKTAADKAAEPNWEKAVDDAESFLADNDNAISTRGAEAASSDSSEEVPIAHFQGPAIHQRGMTQNSEPLGSFHDAQGLAVRNAYRFVARDS